AEVVKRMRGRLRDWMLETRDLGLLDETETLQRAASHKSHWDLGQSLKNYERILDTANLQVRGKTARAELLARADDPDAAVRFWAVLGLVALRSDDAKVIAALQAATKDESVSVRITAADGLFNLGRYEDGLPAIIAALGHPIPAARIRASCVLDTQPPSANPKLQPAIAALKDAASKVNVKKMSGIPYGLNQPFERAIKAITGEETYYRW
ncbi:MAG: HEAT repeat domain-containing protein, partial [Longimicrobiales bacterium]